MNNIFNGPLSFSATKFSEEDKALVREWLDKVRITNSKPDRLYSNMHPDTFDAYTQFCVRLREKIGIDGIYDLIDLVHREEGMP